MAADVVRAAQLLSQQAYVVSVHAAVLAHNVVPVQQQLLARAATAFCTLLVQAPAGVFGAGAQDVHAAVQDAAAQLGGQLVEARGVVRALRFQEQAQQQQQPPAAQAVPPAGRPAEQIAALQQQLAAMQQQRVHDTQVKEVQRERRAAQDAQAELQRRTAADEERKRLEALQARGRTGEHTS